MKQVIMLVAVLYVAYCLAIVGALAQSSPPDSSSPPKGQDRR